VCILERVITNGIGGDGPEPAGRAPAPPGLRVVQDFVNSVDLEAGVDRFTNLEGLRSWLVERELASATDDFGENDLAEALQAREAIRALVGANNGIDPEADAVGLLNEILASAPLRLNFDAVDRARLEPTVPGVRGALSSVFAAIFASMTEGSWSRLKACRRDVCHWVFYDYSRNRSGTWCAMAICGNRTKTKAYYRRRTSTRATTDGRQSPSA
jgi:predicted RNA-binding Zn ribbon-like protein